MRKFPHFLPSRDHKPGADECSEPPSPALIPGEGGGGLGGECIANGGLEDPGGHFLQAGQARTGGGFRSHRPVLSPAGPLLATVPLHQD